MSRSTLARALFAVTALAVLVGLAFQLPVSARLTGTTFDSPAALVANVFCYFTVQSNILVAATTGLLAVDLHRRSTVFRVFRLSSMVAITITGIVYHLALKDLQELGGAALVADTLLHTVVPVLAVVGWVVFGPRGLTSVRLAALATVFPVAWVVFTLIRGEIIDWYPYPFVDVNDLGYARVGANLVAIALLFFALAAAAMVADRALKRFATVS